MLFSKCTFFTYDFQYNPTLQHLSMAGNTISEMVPGSLPPLVKHLHVGRNHLQSLNRTLRYNTFLIIDNLRSFAILPEHIGHPVYHSNAGSHLIGSIHRWCNDQLHGLGRMIKQTCTEIIRTRREQSSLQSSHVVETIRFEEWLYFSLLTFSFNPRVASKR